MPPKKQKTKPTEAVTIDDIITQSEPEEVSPEIQNQIDEEAKAKARTDAKSKGKKAAAKPDISIPAPKSNIITVAALQKEIHSLTLQQGLTIHRARRVYSTGCVGLDAAIGKIDPIKGNGGIPELSILEIYGRPGVRKSNFAETLAFNILEDDPNNIVVFFYTEDPDLERLYRECARRNLPPDIIHGRFQIMGLCDPAAMGDTIKTAEDRLMDLVESAKYDNVKLIVIDSLKALVAATQVFKKGDAAQGTKPIEDDEVAIRAKLMEKLFNRLLYQRRSAIFLMTNQQTEKIPNRNDRFVISNGQDRTPAGTLKEFLSVIRIQANGSPLYEKEKLTITGDKDSAHCPQAGILQIYKIKKNRWGRPNVRVVVPFDFASGKYDNALEVLTLGMHLDLIDRRGANYYFGDVKCSSKDAALCYLDDHPDVMHKLYLEIMKLGPKIYQIDRPGEERASVNALKVLESDVSVEDDMDHGVDPDTGEVLVHSASVESQNVEVALA